MKIKGLHIAIISLACLTVISLAGSSLGTLAWYAYSTRATMAYSGTAVQKTEQLQIGLEWDTTKHSLTSPEVTQYKTDYEATFETIDNKAYVFMAAGSGFNSAGISRYLELHGYATNELPPVTSRSYTAGTTSFALYESPTFGYPNNTAPAASNRYVKLPFAFRIKANAATAVGQKIWLTDVTAAAVGDKDVKDALRVHVHNDDANSTNNEFILHPTSESTTGGFTYVGGVLDLNGDGLYDYGDQLVNSVTRSVEYRYGECEPASGVDPAPFTSTYYDNINNVSGVDNDHLADSKSTFLAQHVKDIYGFTSYSNITRGKANYLSFAQIRPLDSGGASFTGDYPIAVTNASTGIGTCTLTVWLEGWDHAIVDANIGAKFNLGLQFEINRV